MCKLKFILCIFIFLISSLVNTYAQENDSTMIQNPVTNLKDVTISITKPIYVNDGEKKLYNVSEDPSVQTGTASDALQNAPGVEVDIEGNITLRGVSSVEIWINDRPSRLNAENLKTYIQQLPANSLERIEVITNPSARYTAKGTGGIINIVTKSKVQKNTFLSFGLNGSTRPMASPWLSYMFSNEKFSLNVYLNGYYYFSKNKSNGYHIIFNDKMDTSSYRNFTKEYKSHYISTGAYLNGSYKIDSLKTFSFWVNYWGTPFSSSNSFQDYKYLEYINNPGIYDYFEEAKGNDSYMGGNLGVEYEHNFNDDGHTLTTELWISLSNNYSTKKYQRIYENYPHLNKNNKTIYDSKDFGGGVEMNYSLPYLDDAGLIEIGVDWWYNSDRDVNRTDTLFSEIYLLDSMRFQDYLYRINDLDAYITVEHQFGDFKIKGGLRTENRFLNFNVFNQPEHNGNKTFAGLYPSLHLSYSTKKMHNFNLSYARRVRYPYASRVCTFVIYDDDSFSVGNPNLKSTYTNSMESGWTKYFSKFGSVGLTAYYRNNRNEINSLTDVIYNDYFGRLVTFSKPVNSGKSHRYGGDVNVTYKLKAFMNIRLNAGIYQSHSETVFRNEKQPIITDFFAYNFRLNFWAKLWKFLEVNASGNYRSNTKTIFIETAPSYSVNCGLRSDFWDRKISVYLNVQDIFNWGRHKTNNTNPYYIAYNSTKYNSRFISAGITFRFGKIEMESKARTGGNTE
jgi:outer membrane receptor protein involved in Fe transport